MAFRNKPLRGGRGGRRQDNNRGRNTRGGLQRGLSIVEPNLQPANIIDKIGNVGKPIRLTANFARFQVVHYDCYNMYDVVVSDEALSVKGKIKLIMDIAEKYNFSGPFCFDGRRLFTAVNWHTNSDVEEFNLGQHKFSIRYITQIKTGSEEYYQMLNVVFNNIQVFMGQERIGRQYYLDARTDKRTIDINSGPGYYEINNFRVLGGFSTSLQRGTKSDGTTSILLYLERINRVLNNNNVISAYMKGKASTLIGRDVITKYNNKSYRISGIKEMSIGEEFDMGERKLSYYDYFKERYNIKLQYTNQPFVLTKMKRMNISRQQPTKSTEIKKEPEVNLTLNIPGELCYLCGFSEQERTNVELQKSLASILRREPRERMQDIPLFCNWISKNDQAQNYIKSWDLSINNRPLEIDGRELPAVEIFSGGQQINTQSSDDWKFSNIRFQTKNRSHELYVLIVDRNDYLFNKFLQDVKNEIKNLQMNVQLKSIEKCAPNEIDQHLSNITRSSEDPLKIALIFVPDDKVYARVKNFTLHTGLLTQCVTTRNGVNKVDNKRKTVACKTVMQIFSKLGYDPWYVEIKLRPTMIVGLDTYHNKGSKKSIQASVFSINSAFSQYISFVNSPRGKQEYHEVLGRNFSAALNYFYSKYNIFPHRIMIYRDGVGDSQMEFTKKFEADALKPIMERIYRTKGFQLPQIIFIVVKKRINTKLFKNNQNPLSGTVVDQEIVKPNFYEFFLVSQNANRGTVTPTNYNVLEDSKIMTKSGILEPMPINELQKITYTLSHLYFNWQGTIRVPAPTHYAHRLAELIGKIHRGNAPPVINDRIRDRLFYL